MPYNSSTLAAYSAGVILFGVVVGLISLFISVLIWWKIFSKAGYSGAMSLWLFVPIANLIVILMLAFSEWPIHRELNQLRQMAGGRPGPGGQFPPQYPPQAPQYQQPGQYPQPQYPQSGQYPPQ